MIYFQSYLFSIILFYYPSFKFYLKEDHVHWWRRKIALIDKRKLAWRMELQAASLLWHGTRLCKLPSLKADFYKLCKLPRYHRDNTSINIKCLVSNGLTPTSFCDLHSTEFVIPVFNYVANYLFIATIATQYASLPDHFILVTNFIFITFFRFEEEEEYYFVLIHYTERWKQSSCYWSSFDR